MPDVRAVQETIQFQAGSPATITVTAADTAGDPVDVTGLTFVVALRPTGTITATTSDPEAGTRVFSLTGADTTSIATGGGLYSIADGDAEWIVGTARASTEGTKAQDHTLSVTVGAAQINVEVAAAIGAGSGGGLTIEEIIDGVRLEFQRSDVHVTTDAEFVMDDHDRILITAGTQVTLPSAESMAGQEVTVYGTSNEVLILPATGESVLGEPSFTLPAPPGDGGSNSVKFVAVDASAFGVGWSWAQTLRQGPAWDIPDWAGLVEGRILATSNSTSKQPTYIPAGTPGQVMMWRALPGPDEVPSPGFVDPDELNIQAADVGLTGTGLFVGVSDADGAIQRAEGTLDRPLYCSAFAVDTANSLDLGAVMGPGEVVTQPELDYGIAPVRNGFVFVDGRTDPAEDGAYLVGGDDNLGVWVKAVSPDVFIPGNGATRHLLAPGEPEHGMTYTYFDDNRTKSKRVAGLDAGDEAFETSGTGSWRLTFDPTATGGGAELSDDNPAALGTAAPGASTEAARADHVHPAPTRARAYGQDEGSAVTATTLTTLLDAPVDLGSLAAGDAVQFEAGVKSFNNSGSSKTHQLAVFVNGTQVGAAVTSPTLGTLGTPRDVLITGTIRVESTTDVNGQMLVMYPTGQPPYILGQAAVSDTSASATIDLRGAVSSGGSQELTVQHISVVKVPAA